MSRSQAFIVAGSSESLAAPVHGRASRELFLARRYVTPSIARFVSLEVSAIDTL
jgi:hypothetical protein